MHMLFVRTDVVDDVPVESIDLLQGQATAGDVRDYVLNDIRSPLKIIRPDGVTGIPAQGVMDIIAPDDVARSGSGHVNGVTVPELHHEREDVVEFDHVVASVQKRHEFLLNVAVSGGAALRQDLL